MRFEEQQEPHMVDHGGEGIFRGEHTSLVGLVKAALRPRIAEIRARYEQLLKMYPMVQGQDQA